MSGLVFEKMTLVNFKNFAGEHTLKLGRAPGLYFVGGNNKVNPELGANGVGKSSLWDGLLWILTGKTGRDNKPGSAIQPWNGNKNTSGELEFTRNGIQYGLRRTRNPNTLVINEPINEENDYGEREIQQEEVANYLGMSEEMFRRTIVAAQNAVLFLDLRPEAQARMFSEALDLDIYLAASEFASSSAKEYNSLHRDITDDKNSEAAIIASLKEQIVEAKKRRMAFEAEVLQKTEDAKLELATAKARLGAHKAEEPARPPVLDVKNKSSLIKQIRQLREECEEKISALRKRYKPRPCSKCGQPVEDEELKERLAETRNMYAEQEALVSDELETIVKSEEVAHKKARRLAEDYKEWEDEKSRLEFAVDKAMSKIKNVSTADNPYEAEITRLRRKRAQHKERVAEQTTRLEELQTAAGLSEFWVKGFKEIRLSIIDEVLAELELASNRHAEALGLLNWRIAFETEREAKSGNVSYGFSVMLYPPGAEKPVKWESYSGGESQRWQLAVTFALSEVLLARAGIDPNMEVLDEPTRGLSPEGVADLLMVLRDRAVELGRVVYVCDHHSLDRGAFDGVLLVTKSKKGSSFAWM